MLKIKKLSSAHKHDILVYTIYAIILALLLFAGSAHIHADSFEFPKQNIYYLQSYKPVRSRINANNNRQNLRRNHIYNHKNFVSVREYNMHKPVTQQVNKSRTYVHNTRTKNINTNRTIRTIRRSYPKLRVGATHANYINLKHVKKHTNHANNNWFRDGLSHRNFKARSWVAWHESSDRWYVVSYGHICIGYFQLNPAYLGYKHGHINLNPKHQVKVADQYAKERYGNWVNAKAFWLVNHWY